MDRRGDLYFCSLGASLLAKDLILPASGAACIVLGSISENG